MLETLVFREVAYPHLQRTGLFIGAGILSLSSLAGCDAIGPDPVPEFDHDAFNAYCEDLKVTVVDAEQHTVSVTSDYVVGTGFKYVSTSYIFEEKGASKTVTNPHKEVVHTYPDRPGEQRYTITAVVNAADQDTPEEVFGSPHWCQETVTFSD
jgi:hypothetical protein